MAPYLGRMNDAGRDGFGVVVEMQKTADKLDSDMRILVASVRNVGDIAKLAAEGCDTFTISAQIAEQMFSGAGLSSFTHTASLFTALYGVQYTLLNPGRTARPESHDFLLIQVIHVTNITTD